MGRKRTGRQLRRRDFIPMGQLNAITQRKGRRLRSHTFSDPSPNVPVPRHRVHKRTREKNHQKQQKASLRHSATLPRCGQQLPVLAPPLRIVSLIQLQDQDLTLLPLRTAGLPCAPLALSRQIYLPGNQQTREIYRMLPFSPGIGQSRIFRQTFLSDLPTWLPTLAENPALFAVLLRS